MISRMIIKNITAKGNTSAAAFVNKASSSLESLNSSFSSISSPLEYFRHQKYLYHKKCFFQNESPAFSGALFFVTQSGQKTRPDSDERAKKKNPPPPKTVRNPTFSICFSFSMAFSFYLILCNYIIYFAFCQ